MLPNIDDVRTMTNKVQIEEITETILEISKRGNNSFEYCDLRKAVKKQLIDGGYSVKKHFFTEYGRVVYRISW